MTTPEFPLTPELSATLESIYADLQRDINALRPACRQSGDCCNFTKVEHVLYATPLEITHLLQHHPLPAVMPANGSCPFLTADLKCGVRDHRMLGCRIYYCDPNYTAAGQDLYEKYLGRIKTAYRAAEISYAFVPVMKDFVCRMQSNP